MSSSFLQLLVLAGIAIFLILKLRSVLGTRDGFEKPPVPLDQVRPRLVETPGRAETVDRDITDHVAEGSPAAQALAILEPVLSETVCATCLTVIREATDEAVRRGVPEQAARDFILGHLNVELAILFDQLPGVRMSDAANKAVERAKEEIFAPDWKKVFEPESTNAPVPVLVMPKPPATLPETVSCVPATLKVLLALDVMLAPLQLSVSTLKAKERYAEDVF